MAFAFAAEEKDCVIFLDGIRCRPNLFLLARNNFLSNRSANFVEYFVGAIRAADQTDR